MSNNRKKYDEEFKKRAVRMSYSSERSVAAVASSLGVTGNMIYRWRSTRRTAIKRSWPNSRTNSVNSAKGLQNEENYILKKASAFFAKHQK